jgi:valyl-tRNA synthetase
MKMVLVITSQAAKLAEKAAKDAKFAAKQAALSAKQTAAAEKGSNDKKAALKAEAEAKKVFIKQVFKVSI